MELRRHEPRPANQADTTSPAKWWRWAPLLLMAIAVIAGRPRPSQPVSNGRPAWRPWIPLANAIDHKIGWDKLPWPIGLPLVVTFLRQLRRDNLHDPSAITPSQPQPPLIPTSTRHLVARTADGAFNDLAQPRMGSAMTRFGRNVPLAQTWREPEAALP